MILNVPYQSQEPLEDGDVKKWCGIASLWMVLAFYLKDKAPSPEELLEKYGSAFEHTGFQHKELIKIAREYGLRGFRKSWWVEPGVLPLLEKFRSEGESEEDINDWLDINLDESLHTLQKLIEKDIPVIISVNPEFSPGNSTHLVVLIGWENNQLIIHDPYKKGANYKISVKDFKKYWLKQAIIIRSKVYT